LTPPRVPRVTLFWFRRDLRLDDNPGLLEALRSPHPVLPFFLFDRDILRGLRRQDARVEFIHRAVTGLDASLRERGSALLAEEGRPLPVLWKVLARWRVAEVHANRDWEPAGIRRDDAVAAFLRGKGVPFRLSSDHAILPPGAVLKEDGTPYAVFTPYHRRWRALLSASPPAPVPSERALSGLLRRKAAGVPSPGRLGFAPAGIPFPPKRIPLDVVRTYDRTRDLPAREGTTRLGVHLRFGTLGLRALVARTWGLNATFLQELAWRDFFLQVMAHHPRVVEEPFRREFRAVRWRDDREAFRRWRSGETGYPWVDAGIRQLNATGFMHNRVRMAAASFLAKHLLCDWRRGEAYFAEKLLDFELSSNNGNWQWAAGCGCDAAPYFRVFNPALQAKRFDPDGEYVRRWVPEAGTARYPRPLVEHGAARERALSAFRAAARARRS
jgi:deoxyribodipyrimidine photo-lyase